MLCLLIEDIDLRKVNEILNVSLTNHRIDFFCVYVRNILMTQNYELYWIVTSLLYFYLFMTYTKRNGNGSISIVYNKETTEIVMAHVFTQHKSFYLRSNQLYLLCLIYFYDMI